MQHASLNSDAHPGILLCSIGMGAPGILTAVGERAPLLRAILALTLCVGGASTNHANVALAVGRVQSNPRQAQDDPPAAKGDPFKSPDAPTQMPDDPVQARGRSPEISGDPSKPEDAGVVPTEPQLIVIIEGQVTNYIGAGEQDVTVTARRKLDGGGSGDVIATATTDRMGDFALAVPEPFHGDVEVAFAKPLYAELTRDVQLGDDEYPPYLAVTLEGKLVTGGRVIDALSDVPVAGAVVTLVAHYRELSETTDDAGRFTIKGVLPGRGELTVKAGGYGRESWPIPDLEDEGDITIRLKPERVVHIKAIDSQGKPIPGVTVECLDEPRSDFRTIVTGDGGTVTLNGLHFDADILDIRLTHQDYVSSQEFDHEILTPEEKAESSHELVMVSAGRVAGHVTDAQTGEPVHGARVMAGDEYANISPRAWVDHRGEYEIHGVPPGTVTVTVHARDHAPDLKTTEVVAGETTTADFSLETGGTLSGTVKDEKGKPIAGAYVEATSWRDRLTLGLRAITNAKGAFRIDDTPHDEFDIQVARPGCGQTPKTLTVDPSKGVEVVLPAERVASAARSRTPQIGEQAPDVTFTTMEGKTLTLSALGGKTILLDFWATWCPPCIEEMPLLIDIHERFGSRDDFVMIGISRDHEKKALERFLQRNPRVKWHQVIGEDGGVEAARKQYNIHGVPRVFLIGPDGTILDNHLRGEDMIKRVEQAFADDNKERAEP